MHFLFIKLAGNLIYPDNCKKNLDNYFETQTNLEVTDFVNNLNGPDRNNR